MLKLNYVIKHLFYFLLGINDSNTIAFLYFHYLLAEAGTYCAVGGLGEKNLRLINIGLTVVTLYCTLKKSPDKPVMS